MDAPGRRVRPGPARAVLTGLGAALLALVVLLAPLAPEPTALPVVLGVLALAVVAHGALRLPLLFLRSGGALPPTAYAAWPTRRALVLDVEHHPRRPRAPGTR